MLSSKLQLSFLLACFVCFFSCQNAPSTTEVEHTAIEETPNATSIKYSVTPPLENVDVAFKTFDMKASEAKTIEFKNGTSIEIPANAFVDANGNLVTEDVEIRYREFHDAADVLASGIPMKVVQKDGREAYMQTAGMFEINAYVAELPVQLADNKEIMVNMASNVPGAYDFWNYDAKEGRWINAGVNNPVKNPKKEAAKQELAQLEKSGLVNVKPPMKPVKFDKAKPVLNFDVNYSAFPELNKMNGIVWQYSGSDPKMSPRKNKWIYKEEWDYVDLKTGDRPNEFQMVLSNKEKKFVMDVCPSQKGKQFEQAMADYQAKLKGYKAGTGNLAAKKEVYKAQAEFVRSFAISGMGIHNYDILLKNSDNIMVNADFDFGTVSPELAKMIPVYLISADRRSVVAFPKHDWNKFGFDPNQENLIVAVLPGNKLAAFTQEDFQNNFDALQNANDGEFTFKLKEIAGGVKSLADLKGMIEQV